jgi:hypothetical protein
MQSEIERFPRLFQAVESIPGLTCPTLLLQQNLAVRGLQKTRSILVPERLAFLMASIITATL